jgi:ABC-type bacteriocin/lantibiotic exporter with double-glycine peptidase domain
MILVVVVSGQLCAQTRQSPSDKSASDATHAVWRTARACAPNSLFVFLRLCGQSVSYSDVTESLPIDQSGASLADLRAHAARFRVTAIVVRASPTTLSEQSFPAIAHWEETNTSGGHFVVVTAVANDAVEYIDGTTAQISQVPMGQFAKLWTGYLLVPDHSPVHRAHTILLVIVCVMLPVALYSLLRKHKGVDHKT